MIEKIRESIGQGKFETNIYLQFTKFHLQEDCLSLVLSIFLDQQDNEKLVEQWHLDCRGWEDYRLEDFLSYEEDEFELTTHHPYLWDYHEPLIELYFKGKPTNSKALIGELFLNHHKLTTNSIQLDYYLNVRTDIGELEWLLGSAQGLFSEAPRILTDSYKETLEKYGLSTYQLAPKQISNKPEFHLLRLGPSYIIAREFEVEKIRSEDWN